MTAVEWLIQELAKTDQRMLGKVLVLHEQAKEMDKKQKAYFFECGRQYQLTGEGTFTEVYNETFNEK